MTSADSSWLRRRLSQLGRALDPAADDRHRMLDRLDNLLKDNERQASRDRKQIAALEKALSAVASSVAGSERQLADVRGLALRHRDLLKRFSEQSHLDAAGAAADEQVSDRLSRIARSGRPVVVGPWTGEVGFELLYWIPFLQWACRTYSIEPERLVILSRGGVRDWYAHVSSQYEDIFSFASPAEFHAATTERKKQRRVQSFDRAVIRQVVKRHGLGRAHVLHPSLMYTLFATFWEDVASAREIESHTRFRPLPTVDNTLLEGRRLPASFVAVRFYFSECFPDTAGNRAFAAQVIESLAASGDVVLLNSGITVDDHYDFSPERASRIHSLGPDIRPELNLALQTAAISRASAFIGTYGGFSYLAPFYGVPSIAFYSHVTFKRYHLELAHRVYERLQLPPLTPIDVSVASHVRAAVAGAGDTRPKAGGFDWRHQLNALPWPERFERLHEMDRAAAAERAALGQLREDMSLAALDELQADWDGGILKHQVMALPAKRMRPSLIKATQALRDRVTRGLIDAGGPLVGPAAPDVRFGTGFDERVVEIPLALRVARLESDGDVLDAGAALNVPVVRDVVPRCTARLLHFTLPGSDEPIWREDANVTYEFGDLRRMPFASDRFDRIVCVSTLEHVGMDTTRFGAPRADGGPDSAAAAVGELLRVLRPGGQLLLTVPYGESSDRGWYRIFDRPALDSLLEPVAGHEVNRRFFYYDRGWFEGGVEIPDAARAAAARQRDAVTGVAIALIGKRTEAIREQLDGVTRG